MHDPALMRGFERFGDLPGEAKRLGERHSAGLQPAMQRLPGDVLHDDEQGVAVFANLEDLADVRVIERGDGHRLAAKAFSRTRISRPCPPAAP